MRIYARKSSVKSAECSMQLTSAKLMLSRRVLLAAAKPLTKRLSSKKRPSLSPSGKRSRTNSGRCSPQPGSLSLSGSREAVVGVEAEVVQCQRLRCQLMRRRTIECLAGIAEESSMKLPRRGTFHTARRKRRT